MSLGLSGNCADCGGVLDATKAVIMSPGYPNNYPPSLDCRWVLQVPDGDVIWLTTQDLHLEENCTKDYVRVIDGIHIESPVIGNFCGSNSPAPIVSSSGVLTVIFHSDEYGTAPGFKMTTADVQRGCGGLIHMNQGNFTSPNYPSKYDANVECVWTIEYTEDYFVKVDFEGRFDIEMDPICSKDYLQFEDLENNGTWITTERKCGSALPDTFISKANKLRVTFHSNERINGDGFNLKYSSICGGNFTHEKGSIKSPNYPSKYAKKLLCKYVIGKPGDYITLVFDRLFNIDDAGNCKYDSLEIFQEEENANNSQGVYCGRRPPAPRSLRGPIILKFKSDVLNEYEGFKVSYEILNCNKILTEPSGIILSPLSSKLHMTLRILDCKWQIIAPPDKVIALRFLQQNLRMSPGCSETYLEMRDGNETGPVIQKFCGYPVPDIIKSKSNQMRLRFYHQLRITQGNFTLHYYHTVGAAHGCGGRLRGDSGEIQSVDTDLDGLYEPNLDCGWFIVPTNLNPIINITFSKFDLEEPQNGTCLSDYLEFKEYSFRGTLIGRYCGSSLPAPLISSANRVFVHFHTDEINNQPGFKFTYTVSPSPCGSTNLIATKEPQVLTSPNYPNPYPSNVQCKWFIFLNKTTRYHANRYSAVEILINDLDIACGDNDGDYFEVKKISTPYSYFTRTCGRNNFPGIEAITEGVEITLHSNSVNHGAKGFSLTFQEDSCHKNLTYDEGVIHKFNFRQDWRCTINITAPEGKTVSLYFIGFTLYGLCPSSRVDIYDGQNATYPLITTLCEFDNPDPVFSTGRSLFLDFRMPYRFGYYYFMYMTTDKGRGCGGNITATEGRITSPLYPLPYNQTGECIWRIVTPGYHTAKINFVVFNLNSTSCDTNYLEIFDGPIDNASSRIARYCGNDIPADHTFLTNHIVVKMVTDTTNDQPGFVMDFRSKTIVADPSMKYLEINDPYGDDI